MSHAGRALLIWMTTAMLCAQAFGSTTLFRCCCGQSQMLQGLQKTAHCCRQQLTATQAETNSPSCCNQKLASSTKTQEKDAGLVNFDRQHVRCLCSPDGTSSTFPIRLSQAFGVVKVLDLQGTPESVAMPSFSTENTSVRGLSQLAAGARPSAQLLLCVSLT